MILIAWWLVYFGVCCLDVCFYLFVFLFKWVLRLVFRVFFVCYVLLIVWLILFLHFSCLFGLVFGNCVRFWVVQNVLRLDLLFFCSRFFLLEIGYLLSFSILNHRQIRKFLLLCFLCIDFLLGMFYIIFVEYTLIHSPFNFLLFL